MRIPLPIQTERLLIRAFEPEVDAAAMIDVYCDPEVMRYVTGGALGGIEEVEGELRKHAAHQAERGFSYWAVVERESGRVIGDTGFDLFERTEDIQLGYTLARDCWGRGFGTEAASACLAAGLRSLSASRIVIVVEAANAASVRVAERLGMERIETFEAHGQPHLVFACSRA
jgi:ribosomal-protein-alanine N-acetyltransferase